MKLKPKKNVKPDRGEFIESILFKERINKREALYDIFNGTKNNNSTIILLNSDDLDRFF